MYNQYKVSFFVLPSTVICLAEQHIVNLCDDNDYNIVINHLTNFYLIACSRCACRTSGF